MADESAATPLSLHPRDAVLVAGPPMTGKYQLALRSAAAAADRLVVVSTDTVAAQVHADAADLGIDPEAVGIIDCTTKSDPDLEDTDAVRYVHSPENLTQIGVQFTSLTETFAQTGVPIAVVFDSLSPLLMYWDTQRIYQFVRVFLDRVRESDVTCVATIGSTMHDEQTLHTLYDPFDAVIETRETDGVRELRRRTRSETTDWEPY